MKKKGFTLVELLGVLLILATIMLIALPSITGLLKKQKENTYQQFLNDLYLATEAYVQGSDSYDLSSPNQKVYVKIEDVVQGKYLKSTTVNPKTNEKVNLQHYVKIVVNDDHTLNYEYVTEAPIIVESSKVYGIKRSLTTSSTAWERIENSVGLVANAQVGTTPVKNDFDNIYPWSDIISYNYDTTTKQIIAYYGDSNFTFSPTGNVEVLTKIPEFYYRRYQDDTYEYIYISREAKEGYTKSEEFSIGRYTMSGNATRVHSRSGAAPLVSTTITQFRTYASNLGEEFSQLDYHYFILQLLYLVEYADYNSQSKLGVGYTNASHTGPVNSGGCNILGMHSGSVDGTDDTSMIYRGIEDIFGNIFQFVDGINVKDNQVYICYDKTQYASDRFTGCYQPIGYVNANTNAYISKLGYDSNNPLVAFSIQASGSDSTYISDYYVQNSGNRIALVGGPWNNSLKEGLWDWNVHGASSGAWDNAGARLLKTG